MKIAFICCTLAAIVFAARFPMPGVPNEDSGAVALSLISAVQGDGTASPLNGDTVMIEGIVVGDFQEGDADETRNLRGFFVQEEDADADTDPLTSEGIFVYDGASPSVDVAVGDKVRITGEAAEYYGATEITNIAEIVVICSGNALPALVDIVLPAGSAVLNSDGEYIGDLERYEGMRVRFAGPLTVCELYLLDRFGEFRVSAGGRPEQFTQGNAPDAAGYAAHVQDMAKRTLTVDDGRTDSYPDPVIYPDGALDPGDSFRAGDIVTDLTGVLAFRRGDGAKGRETYRLMPTAMPVFTQVNSRPASPPSVDGRLKTACLNVLNLFNGDGAGGGFPASRGASTPGEYNRQIQKLVTVLHGMDADIFGLMELENDYVRGAESAVAQLVDELNAAAGANAYAYIDPGVNIGDDEIAVGIIYRPASVSLAPGTAPAILEDSDLAGIGMSGTVFNGPGTNRSPLAATFEENATGEAFTFVVVHMKSKGSAGPNAGDDDGGDGQGFSNGTRMLGVQALTAWLASDPTGGGDPDFLIAGDFNAYAREDPIVYLEGQGLTDLARNFIGDDVCSYVYDGQSGTLDYAFAGTSLLPQTTGAAVWRINADEADALDYNEENVPGALFDGASPYRASDHDPVLVGLRLRSGGGRLKS